MSIEKWISEREPEEIRKKKEELFKKLPKEQIQDLKKKSIKSIVINDSKNPESDSADSFLGKVIEFKDWLDGRTYLKGDIDKIMIKLQNLNTSIANMNEVNKNALNENKMSSLKNLYNEVPPSLLDEKTRVALNKKLRGVKRTNSDNYYLRKLKKRIGEKLNETKYYEILKEILES